MTAAKDRPWIAAEATFGLSCLPAIPAIECARLAALCEKHGFGSFWVADEIWYRDPWAIMAVCAQATSRIRIGPGATHVYLRNPALLAQALATLDEVSNGRCMCGIAIGNEVMLRQCRVDRKHSIRTLRDAVSVIRQLLRGETVHFEGEHFSYAGVSLTMRPTQEHVPIYIAAKAGPQSFELAGEIGDGALLSDVYTASWARHVMERLQSGHDRAGPRAQDGPFDVADWILLGIHDDARVARQIVRPLACFYLPMQFPSQLAAYGISPSLRGEVAALIAAGQFEQALKLTDDEVVENLSVVGNPSQVAERLAQLRAAGITHFVLALADNATLRTLGLARHLVHDALTQEESVRLLADKVIPSFER